MGDEALRENRMRTSRGETERRKCPEMHVAVAFYLRRLPTKHAWIALHASIANQRRSNFDGRRSWNQFDRANAGKRERFGRRTQCTARRDRWKLWPYAYADLNVPMKKRTQTHNSFAHISCLISDRRDANPNEMFLSIVFTGHFYFRYSFEYGNHSAT